MIPAFLQRGIAAGILSALFVIGTGPAALAQAQRSTQPSTRRSGQAGAGSKPAAKPAPTAGPTQPSPPGRQRRLPRRSGGHAARPAQAATGPGGASLLASFGDWGVYTAQTGRSKICYALTQPKDRLPKNLNRDPAYLFVSFRPAENVRNEVALVMGFAAKENGPAEAAIGTASYALLTKDANAWLKNPAEEGQAIATMAQAAAWR